MASRECADNGMVFAPSASSAPVATAGSATAAMLAPNTSVNTRISTRSISANVPSRAKRLCAIFAILLAASLAFCICGCRYSDVLTEHIEDPVNGIVDETREPIYEEQEGAPEDPTRTSSVISESERIDEQEEDEPDYDEEAPEEEETDERDMPSDIANTNATVSGEDNPNADRDTDTTAQSSTSREGNTDNDGDGTQSSSDTSGEDEDPSDSDDPAASGSDTSDTDGDQTDDSSDSGNTQNNPTGAGGDGTVYDSTSDPQDLPQDIGWVAAAGQYATIVQMLGGQGSLVACDQEWKDMVAARGVFPNQGVEDVSVCFYGSQSSGYTVDVNAIIDKGAQAIIVDGISVALSASEQQTLVDAGVSIITLPALGYTYTSDEDILTAVLTVGDMLASSSAAGRASYYKELHDSAINTGTYAVKQFFGSTFACVYQSARDGEQLGGTSGILTTAFIDSWSTNISSTRTSDRVYSNYSLGYLDQDTVDTSDGIGLSMRDSTDEYALIDYYLQLANVTNNSYPSSNPSELAYTILPGGFSDASSSSALELSTTHWTYPSALWYTPYGSSVGGWITVGDAAFPGILVRSDDIATSVVRSANKTNGAYNVGQSYFVRVVPTGVAGSWADGTIESFIMVRWSAGAFGSSQSVSDENTASWVSAFYSYFYGCDDYTQAIDNYDTVYTAECPTN